MTKVGFMLKEEGRKEGEIKAKIEVAKNLLDILPVEEVAKRTGLDIETVKNLKKEMK